MRYFWIVALITVASSFYPGCSCNKDSELVPDGSNGDGDAALADAALADASTDAGSNGCDPEKGSTVEDASVDDRHRRQWVISCVCNDSRNHAAG